MKESFVKVPPLLLLKCHDTTFNGHFTIETGSNSPDLQCPWSKHRTARCFAGIMESWTHSPQNTETGSAFLREERQETKCIPPDTELLRQMDQNLK